MVSLNLVTSAALLIVTFLLGAGGALTSPAWAAIIPQLVPRRDLDSATSANSVGFNLSRALGPALGGIVIAAVGLGAPFWIFAISNFGIVASLLWWLRRARASTACQAERLTSAVRTGIRYAANNEYLRATLARALAFFPFATAYWALLPLLARSQMTGGPEHYGILLGALGVGAIGGSFALNWLKAKLGLDRVVAWATLATALALVLFGLAHETAVAICACLIAGASWTLVLSIFFTFRRRSPCPIGCVGGGLPYSSPWCSGRRRSAARGLGTIGRHGRPRHGAFRGGGRGGHRHSPDMAVEASDRRCRRSDAVDALARAGRDLPRREQQGAGSRDARI